MASRHEIVTIDFRANAAKANPAMKSLQQAARDLREEIDKTRETANEAAKNGATEAELQKFEKEITSQLKTLKQYEAAINSLSKGVGTLARAIDAFNAGTLDKMNATFQKQSFNAAENAKKLLVPGSEGYEKNMAELDALQQKNLENLAKYKLRTEQLLQSIGEGGKISATDLKTEADGLEELMKLLPHLGNEWQEYYQILLRVRDAIKQQADEEKRLKGAVADANDARARSAQLTKQGAEEARQQHEAAKKVVEGETAIISKMKEEREEKRKNMADSAAILQQKDKEIESQRKTVAAWETAIKNEKKDTKAREDRIIALKQENETLQTTADTNRKAVEQMKGDMKGLEDQLKDVNAELEKMGTSASEEPAAVAPAATPAAPAAVKKEETQAVEEKTEADKKEEQAVKDKTKAKKDETQAVKESTEAKKEEAKVSEKLTEMEKEELKNQILARQDELKAQLQDLYNEKKEYARQQEQNTAAAKKEAEAVKEEADAYKDLTKEQAEALLQQKRATITKGEDGRFSFTNAEEAQHFIMESMRQMGGKNGNEYSLSDKGQVKQLLSQFKERYGLQSDDDTVGAIRGLFASGGLVESGVMNPFLPRMNVKASESAAAYAKDMKDLTAIINGNTEAVKENVKVTEESNKAKRTEADIDADIKAKESESKQLTMKLREMNGQLNTTEQLIKKKSSLVETSRKSAEAFKEELAVLRTLNKEQAALMLKGMTEPSTVKFKGGTPFASDVEEVQSWFIKSIKGMVGNGHAFDEGGTLRLDEKGIASMVERFKERYKFDGGKKDLNDLFKSVVQSKGGLFESGFVSDFGKGGKLSINYDALAFEQRIKVMDTLTEVSGGAAKATDKVTKSTKDNTAAAKENTDTISEQERKVADLKQKWDDAKEEYRKYNDEYKRQMREVKRLEKGSIDEQLLAREKESAAETYKETYVDKAATRRDQYKQLYTSSNNKLNRMRKAEGQGIQEATAAENQNTEATERNTQAKGRKAKATKAAVDAQKEQNKADGESIAQNQQLSAEEQKKQELLRRRDTLQGQLNEKQEKANQLEEQAAGADTKRENNLKTITNLQNENINAHTKNEQGYKREKENLEKLESQQDKNIKKYNEDKEAVEGFTQKIDEHATKRAEANKRAAQTERLTIDAMNDAIKALETENRAIDPQSAKWQENTRVIQQYKAEIDRLKNQPVLQMMTERMGNIRNLSADALTETKRFWEQMTAGAEHGSHKLAVYEGNLKVIAEEERQRQQQIQAPMRENLNSLGRLSTADLTETKRYWQTVRDGADQTSAAYKKAELAVKALANEEQRRKDHAQAQYISDQMKDLNNLSVSGLAEVKRYWQAMADGAKRGSDEAKDAANALARINEVELRNTKQQVRPLFGDLSKKGTEEIRAAIEAGRRLIDTYDSGSPAAQRLSQAIVDAEEHLKKYGVEAERAARREAAAMEEAAQRRKEQDSLMRQQLDQGAALSDSALKAQQQYWQRLIDDPKTAKESLAGYRYELERTIELQQQQANATRDKYAARLGMPNQFANLSEAELRQSIEAGKQLLSTYKSGSAEAEQLAKNILAAENHIKTYGLEAQRAAQKEAQAVADAEQKRRDADTTMRKQLYNTKDLTESALKTQEQYWKRLIDDPNTAAASLNRYRKDLEQVHLLQEQMEQQRGKDALDFFKNGDYENASADEIKRQSDALKKYRDSLPQQDEADTIQEINELLIKAGVAAQKAAGETMTFKQALRIGMDAKGGNFKGTVEQLTQAKKTLEQLQQTAVKGGLAWRRMQDGIDSINLELKRTSYLSKEVQDILDKPKGRSLNALKQAVEQGRAALQNMDRTTKDGQKAFDELAKKIKATELELKQMSGEAKATVSAFEKAWSRLKTYVGLYVGASVAMNKLMGTIGDIHELSDKMGEVRKTTGFTADEVGRLSTNLKQLDTRTGLTSLMETAAKAGQLGLKSLEDVQGFTQAANMLMVALPEMGQEAATEMLKVALATGEVKKIQDQINKGLIEGSSATEVAMTKIGSAIDQLRANSAAAAPQITDFVKRVGAVGAQSGISIDQVAALGATVDALGMRVEMSATALSRMIPAIKNNAFELAKAIGVTPETVRDLFDTGRGMEVILMIFDRIKESGMDADSIENMLGMAGMKDIMKDLNQQGARAGIVFAGLSQNVDELRRNLRTAGEAYEENIAILSEYNKMNDTTAAKWERLKNQVEELFVGDTAQRWFGYIITGMRWIVDLLTSGNGISAGLRTVIVYLGLVKANIGGILVGIKSCGGGLKGIAMWLGIIDKQTKKLAWGNIFTALAMAALYAWHELSNLKTAIEKANEALGKTKEEVGRAQVRFEGYYQKLKSTSEALQQARISHDKLSAEVDKLRQSTDRSATATANLKKKEDELKKSEDKVTQASRDHKSAISDMNSIYGKYLGFILTEANYSNLAAAAHDKVTAAIEREMLMKQRQAAIGDVDSQYAQDIATGYGKLNERLVSYGKLERREASQAMSDLQKFLRDNVKYDSGSNQSVVSKAVTDQLKGEGLDLSKATADEVVALWYDKYLKENYHISDNVRRGITGVERRNDIDKGWGTVYTPFSTNLRGGYASTYVQREQQRGAVSTVYDTDITRSEGEEAKAAETLLSKLEQQAKQAKKSILDKNTNDKDRNVAYGELANALEGLENRINELNPQQDAETINRLRDMAKSLSSSGIDVKKLKKAREEIHATLFERATFNEDTIKNLDTTNPWGKALGAESTDWKNMTAEQLVNRRKQMKDFVNAIQTDTDVQAVLKEDAALKKAIEKGMSSDMRTVIEWYNTERLKIQDELHARHLTNTGDWMDPKKERGAKKQFRDEMDAYLHELDAYYTERKTRIEEAGTDEGLTEAEIRNRTLNNEMEWQQRRAELQKLYSRKQKEVTQEELDAIYHIIAERTGDSESFVKAQIAKTNQFVDSIEKSGEKGAAIVHRWMSQVELDTERSYLKGQQALTKQMRAIEAIIDKERPFNGITNSLQESLSTMDVLTGDMRKEYNELMKQGKDMTDFNNRQAQEEMKRTAFLLGEAENAYSTTIGNVMDDMRQKGMTAWADWLSADPKLQEALMAQLRSTYDAIQDAIKKEASQLKKQAEIMWNNILMPDGKTTLKQTTDRIVAQLGLDEGRVNRANSLIGAGQASERVADKLAIQQMKVQLAMQDHYYNLMRKQGKAHVDMLNAQAKAAKERGDEEEATRKTLDAQHAQMSLNLATAKEETELAKQREDIIARTEESQNRLYTELKSWADLLSSSMQSLFEASHAGDAEYYNERAKLDLTGNGGPGAGTYVVIDNAGTSDAKAHYEYLDERQALEQQREIEQENAMADAWKKVWDDLNQKMSDTITDQLNAMLQNQSIDANTQAVIANTEALWAQLGQGSASDFSDASKLKRDKNGMAVDESGQPIAPIQPTEVEQSGGVPKAPWQMTEDELSKNQENMYGMWQAYKEYGIAAETEKAAALAEIPGYTPSPLAITEEQVETVGEIHDAMAQKEIDASKKKTEAILADQQKIQKSEQQTDQKMAAGAQGAFAKMIAAANLYGIAYQTMSNDNLSATQKFEMMAVQAAGQSAIAMLTTDLATSEGKTAAKMPGILGQCIEAAGPYAGPVLFAVISGVLGGLLGLAVSKIAKSKSTISQATGSSVGAGRLSTGMLTYAEGNVNEFTDPGTLTPGRQYNVDAADGRTYRARYMGKNAKTHITNGPEFHLVGEKGREAIIDAHTTRLMQMDDIGIWQSIQTLYNGGSRGLSAVRRRGRGVRAFAEGNVDEFEMPDGEAFEGTGGMNAGMSGEQAASLQASIDRQNELLEDLRRNPIHAVFDVYGKSGLVDTYDTAKKTLNRHGEKY